MELFQPCDGKKPLGKARREQLWRGNTPAQDFGGASISVT